MVKTMLFYFFGSDSALNKSLFDFVLFLDIIKKKKRQEVATNINN